MQINFTGKNVEVTQSLREYAETKLRKLVRFFDHVQEARVTQSIQRGQHVFEVTLIVDGTLIRAEERSSDMYTSIDLGVDKLERQLSRFKERYTTHTREALDGQKPTERVALEDGINVPLPELDEEAAGTPMIVRTKRFAVKPMDPEEAALEMELIGHDFYVFRNAESDTVNVIYRRRDGNFGLIEPIV